MEFRARFKAKLWWIQRFRSFLLKSVGYNFRKAVQWQKGRKKSSAKMCAWFPLFKLLLRQSWQKTHQVPVWWAKFWFAEIMWMRELVSFLSLKRQDSKAGTPDPLTILLSANPSRRFSFSSTNAIKWRVPASELSGIEV